MNNDINIPRTSRAAAILLIVVACLAGPQQAGASITSTQCNDGMGGGFGGVVNFGNCYVIDLTYRTWTDAESAAQALDPSFHLTSVHSALEGTFLASLHPDSSIWIGLSDATLEGTFAWSDGTVVDYTDWYSGQPNGGAPDEDYVQFDQSLGWLDSTSSTSLRSVFSAPISAVPVPATAWLFGSGLIGLAGVVRRKQSCPSVNMC